jgi:ABC-2 type transport system permease protein
MEAVLFVLVLVGLNLIPQIRKRKNQTVEFKISTLTAASTLVFSLVNLFYFNNLRLKGLYSIPIINLLFVLTVVIYFSFVTNSRLKIISIPILTVFILLGLLTTFFGQLKYEKKIDDTHKIMVTSGGLMSCGQLLYLTRTTCLMFDKEVHYESSLCLRDITQIDVLRFNNELAEFEIHHNGELENPYRLIIENKNMW